MADDLRAGFEAYIASNPELGNVPRDQLASTLYDQHYSDGRGKSTDPRFADRGDFLKQLGFNTGAGSALVQGGIDFAAGLGDLANRVQRGVRSDILGEQITPETGFGQDVADLKKSATDSVGYASPVTLDDVKNDPSKVGAFAVHGLAQSAAPLAGRVLMGPVLGTASIVGSQLGSSAEQRAKNDGRKDVTASDYLYTAPGALADAVPFGKAVRAFRGAPKSGGVIKSAVGVGASEATAGALQNVGETLDTKRGLNIEDVGDSALAGALIGAPLGAGARIAGAPFRPGEPKDPAVDDAKASVAQRLIANAESLGVRLDDSDPNSNTSGKRALEKTRNDLLVELQHTEKLLKGQLRDNIPAQQALRSVKNAVEGKTGKADFSAIQEAVGNTQEGAQLVSVLRQLDVVRDLRRSPLRGGVSGKIANANPFNRESPYHGGVKSLGQLGAVAGAVTDPVTTGAVGAGMGAAWLGARGAERAYGAVTGRGDPGRPLKAFAHRYGKKAPAAPATDMPSVVAQRTQEAAATEVTRTQRLAERDAQRARAAEDWQRGRADNVPVHPFDVVIYDETGLLPQQASLAVERLASEGRLGRTPEENEDALRSFRNNPHELQGAANVGNSIISRLKDLVRRNEVQSDPAWPGAAKKSTTQEQRAPAYDPRQIQGEANQLRVTAAQTSAQHDKRLPQGQRLILAQGIAAVGKATNRADADKARQGALGLLDPQFRSIAQTYLSPLLKDKTHATKEQADKAGDSNRAVRHPMTREMSRRQMAKSPEERAAYEQRLVQAGAAKVAPERLSAAKGEATVEVQRPAKDNYQRRHNAVSRREASIYKAGAGIDKPDLPGKLPMPQAYLEKVADWFDKTPVNDLARPEVKKAYDALARETVAQYEAIGRDVKAEPWSGKGEPYRNSGAMLDDVRKNRHLWFYRTTPETFGQEGVDYSGHPLLAPTKFKGTDGKPLLANDVFRIVHDYFGHTQNAFQFGPDGEYNAFHQHARMFSDDAIPALAAETLAQNAWVNNGPQVRGKNVPMKDRRFADQKATIVPIELLKEDPNAKGMFTASALDKAVDGVNAGGISLDVGRNIDYAGTAHIAVAPFPERTKTFRGEATTERVQKFIDANSDLLEREGFAFGGWFDPESKKTYLDVSVMIPKERADEARQLGKLSNQKSVFDLEKFETIDTGGTGTTDNVAPMAKRMQLIDGLRAEKQPETAGHNGGPDLEAPKFSRQADARRWMQEDFIRANGKLLDISNDADRAVAADKLANDVVDALESGRAKGQGWYSTTIDGMYTKLAEYFPELGETSNGAWSQWRYGFNAALAITSNGLKAKKNLELAIQSYQQFRKTGQFAIVGDGKTARTMEHHLMLTNEIISTHGMNKMIEVMLSEASVKDMKAVGIKISGENVDAMLPLSAIFGPKIGGAFMANLSGNHRHVTMDRWFMRTYSEVTGHHFRDRDPNDIADYVNSFRQYVSEGTARKYGYKSKAEAMANLNDLADTVYKTASERGFTSMTKLEKEARRYLQFTGPIEAPLNGKNRGLMRKMLAEMREKLKAEHHHDLEMSDLQAILWFIEKRRYSEKGIGKDVKGENYEEAAQDLAAEGRIERANDDGRRPRLDRRAGEGRGGPGVPGVGQFVDPRRHQAHRRETGEALLKDEAFLNTLRKFGALKAGKAEEN